MRIHRFDEAKSAKSKKEKDVEVAFKVDSLLDDQGGDEEGLVKKPPFVSELEEMPDAAQKKLKKEIQGITPGLKKSIKKFEEFALVIDLDVQEVDSDTITGCGCCDRCTGTDGCDCGCDDCSCVSSGGELPVEDSCDVCDCNPCGCRNDVVQFSEFGGVSEKLDYHIKNGISVVENVFRPGSESFVSLIKEARLAHDSNSVRFGGQDRYLFEKTDIGRFAEFRGQLVPLDLPMEEVKLTNEAEYKGREVKLNRPVRNTGPGKKYFVYVLNPKTDKVKKISFGDVKGGLTAKVSNAEARRNFASRHNCKDKKDKTKAGYWACRINRYGHLWGGKTYPGFW